MACSTATSWCAAAATRSSPTTISGSALHALRARGLRDIRGDIVVDRSYFAPTSYDPAHFDNEPRRAYNVGTDAFLVNFQAIELHR